MFFKTYWLGMLIGSTFQIWKYSSNPQNWIKFRRLQNVQLFIAHATRPCILLKLTFPKLLNMSMIIIMLCWPSQSRLTKWPLQGTNIHCNQNNFPIAKDHFHWAQNTNSNLDLAPTFGQTWLTKATINLNLIQTHWVRPIQANLDF